MVFSVLVETGGVFVVSEAAVKYHRSARLDDLLTVTARLQQAGKASVVFAQQAWRGEPGQGELLAEGTFRVGWVKAETMQPTRMPPHVLQALAASAVSGA